ncbi:MAG: endonuclease domain-containing protein [Rhodanobacteraceae bacterium]
MGEHGWPFIGTEALAEGTVTRRGLRSGYDPVYRNVYVPKDHELTAVTRGIAAGLWSGRKATAAGLSAAALLGSRWVDPRLSAELYRCNGKPVTGIVIHRDELCDDEVCMIRGISATTPARTAFDLGRRKGLTTAVIRLDGLANATKLKAVEVGDLVRHHRGVRGLVQLRQVLELMDGGAESPQETRTRLVLIDAGLPKPETQIVVYDGFGEPFARIDLGYEEWKVGIEYDGAQHWTDPLQRAYDIDRYAELAALGWLIIRVSADMLSYRPEVIVARVCAALREVGADWPVIARVLLDRVS